jgi:hypothetical protein
LWNALPFKNREVIESSSTNSQVHISPLTVKDENAWVGIRLKLWRKRWDGV